MVSRAATDDDATCPIDANWQSYTAPVCSKFALPAIFKNECRNPYICIVFLPIFSCCLSNMDK